MCNPELKSYISQEIHIILNNFSPFLYDKKALLLLKVNEQELHVAHTYYRIVQIVQIKHKHQQEYVQTKQERTNDEY